MAHTESKPGDLLETQNEILVHVPYQDSDLGCQIEDGFGDLDYSSPFLLVWQTPEGLLCSQCGCYCH